MMAGPSIVALGLSLSQHLLVVTRRGDRAEFINHFGDAEPFRIFASGFRVYEFAMRKIFNRSIPTGEFSVKGASAETYNRETVAGLSRGLRVVDAPKPAVKAQAR